MTTSLHTVRSLLRHADLNSLTTVSVPPWARNTEIRTGPRRYTANTPAAVSW